MTNGINTLGRALQGFGAGVQGRGSEFLGQLDDRRRSALLQDAFAVQEQLRAGDVGGARGTLLQRLDAIGQLGGDPSDTQELISKLDAGDVQGAFADASTVVNFAQAQGLLRAPARAAGPTAAQREFESLTEDLTSEQRQEAKLIKLGLSPRAVGSAIQTIAEKDLAELIGSTSATIKQREKFGEATGASRARTIDKGFERIAKIDEGVRNIDKAITALNQGAGVGAIESLLPSITAASKTLDNVQGLMALDVVGATTFGALSKGELDLAKDVALPTGLDTPALMQHLQDKKLAQQKLRDYFNEQIQFLDQGGTVAGFLRQKDREQAASQVPLAPAQPEAGQIKFLGFE